MKMIFKMYFELKFLKEKDEQKKRNVQIPD